MGGGGISQPLSWVVRKPLRGAIHVRLARQRDGEGNLGGGQSKQGQ